MRDRLGQLHALLHARRVAVHVPVALLEQAHVAQRLGGPFARGVGRDAAHPRHVHHEVDRRDVPGDAVVLGRVAHQLAHLQRLPRDVEAQHRRRAARRLQQPQQDLQQRALAGPVRPHQPHHARLHPQRQRIQRRHARVALVQRLRLDDGAGVIAAAGLGRRSRVEAIHACTVAVDAGSEYVGMTFSAAAFLRPAPGSCGTTRDPLAWRRAIMRRRLGGKACCAATSPSRAARPSGCAPPSPPRSTSRSRRAGRAPAPAGPDDQAGAASGSFA